MKINLKFNDKTLTTTLDNNETARDFVSLLPLTLTLKDYAALGLHPTGIDVALQCAPLGVRPITVIARFRPIRS